MKNSVVSRSLNIRSRGYMKFLIARHCKATGQKPDAELTEVGVQQAHELLAFLEQYPVKVNRILSSPFTRAKKSIEPFSQSKK